MPNVFNANDERVVPMEKKFQILFYLYKAIYFLLYFIFGTPLQKRKGNRRVLF